MDLLTECQRLAPSFLGRTFDPKWIVDRIAVYPRRGGEAVVDCKLRSLKHRDVVLWMGKQSLIPLTELHALLSEPEGILQLFSRTAFVRAEA